MIAKLSAMAAALKAKLARYRKAVAPAVGAVGQLVALGVLHGTALHVAQAVLALATFAGVVASPENAPKRPSLLDGR